MTRFVALIALPVLFGCALAQPPVPSLSPIKTGEVVPTAISTVQDETQAILDDMAAAAPGAEMQDETVTMVGMTRLVGEMRQGGFIIGQTAPGATVTLDDRTVAVDPEGRFIFGFNRDHGETAEIVIRAGDGSTLASRTLNVASFPWRESRIQVEERMANPYTQEDLEKIAQDREKKDMARQLRDPEAMWTSGLIWPVEGCISSRFGNRRIVNGTPRRYHSGVDVAAPDGMSPLDYVGTEIVSPADGIIRLADADMFFEGGLVFIDHGQQLESAMMHLHTVDVTEGQRVSQGDKIGTVGSTGRSTGPHLHWSLKWQERLLDPETAVPFKPVCTD